MKKKLLIISLSTIIVLAASYTGFWFTVKTTAEKSISGALNKLKSQPNIKNVTYNLNTSCFPQLCIQLDNISVQTKENIAGSIKGFKLEALVEKPIIYKTSNIFKPSFNYFEEHGSYDVTSTNIDNNEKTIFFANFEKLALNISKKSSNFELDMLNLETSRFASAFTTALTLNNLKANLAKLKTKNADKEKSSFEFTYTLSDLKMFKENSNTAFTEINHSLMNLEFKDIHKSLIKSLFAAKQSSREFITQSLKNLADNNSEIILNDFKATTDSSQFFVNGQILITPEYQGVINLDASFNFKKPTKLEQLLHAYRVGKNNNDSYVLQVRTNNNILNINNKIQLPAPNFTADFANK